MSFHDEHRDSREADAAGAAGVRPRRSTKTREINLLKRFIMEIKINVIIGISEEARRTAAQICAAILQGRDMKQALPAAAESPAPAESSAPVSSQEKREETAAQATAPAPAAESSAPASPQEQREETAAAAAATTATAETEASAGLKLNPNTPPPQDYEGPLSDIDLRGHMNFVFQRVIGDDWETKVKEDPDAKKKQRQTTAAFKSFARDLGADKPTALPLKDRERFLEMIKNICTGEDGNIQALPF